MLGIYIYIYVLFYIDEFDELSKAKRYLSFSLELHKAVNQLIIDVTLPQQLIDHC